MLNINRRDTLIQLFNGIGLSLISSLANGAEIFGDSSKVLELPLPSLKEVKSPDFEVFFKLSQITCGREGLDREVAGKIFVLFEEEPWGKEHMTQVFTKIIEQNQLTNERESLAQLVVNDVFEEGEKWFISHLLTTWYLGIYYHERLEEPVRVSFEKSLMWDAASNFVTPPGFGVHGYGSWSLPPTNLDAGEGK